MSTSVFKVHEHTLPCTYIREYPLATVDSQEDTLHLAIKQYTPLDNLAPQKGDVTVIAAHANGFPKVSWVVLSKRDEKIADVWPIGVVW
jgi:hypothetical protein